MARLVAILAVLVAFLASPVFAMELTRDQQVQVLREAMAAFDRGAAVRENDSTEALKAFRESARMFEVLVESGVHNGRLYYNLGNAYLESGQLGRAIVSYRRALGLMPDDGRIEHNLRHARSLRRSQIGASGQKAFLHTFFFWHYRTALRTRYLLGLALYVAFWIMMLLRLFMPSMGWRYALVPILVLWVAMGTSVAVETLVQQADREGVVLADDVIVRKGNGERFAPQFQQPLHEGLEFDVLEKRRDWLHIRLPDDKTGWIPAESAELI